jgi:hypothetical protein
MPWIACGPCITSTLHARYRYPSMDEPLVALPSAQLQLAVAAEAVWAASPHSSITFINQLEIAN